MAGFTSDMDKGRVVNLQSRVYKVHICGGRGNSHLWLKWGNNSALLPIFSLFEAFFACFLMESRSIGLSELKNTIKM